MCIINYPAEVTNTEILVSPNRDSKRQLVVYANKVQTTHQGNAMILPVPNPHTVKLHDLSQYSDIFKDCARSFVDESQMMRSLYTNSSFGVSKGITLEVHQCGSYNVSIVPSVNDFHRIDATQFQLNPAVGQILSQYYHNNFGFIVCKLRTGTSETYHPIGYSHQMIKPHTLFVPTRHHHGHEAEVISHYDHNIYSINTKSLAGNAEWTHTFEVNTDKIPNFQFPEVVCFNKFRIKANDMNTDLQFYLDSLVESFGQYRGVDGCLFKTNHPEMKFTNVGSIYIEPTFRGLKLYDSSRPHESIKFAGPGTTFAVDGNRIQVTDDVGTPQEKVIIFQFNPKDTSRSPGFYSGNSSVTWGSPQSLDVFDPFQPVGTTHGLWTTRLQPKPVSEITHPTWHLRS
jgi:hypothetical protein